MIDIWLGDALLILAVAAYPVMLVYRLRPRLMPGEGLVLPSLQSLEAEYRRRYYFRLICFRILPAVLAIYFGYRALTWPADKGPGSPDAPAFLTVIFAAYGASVIAGSIMRIVHERSFVKEHPIFADSVLPVRARVAAVVPLTLSLGCFIAGLSFLGSDLAVVLVVMGFLGTIISRKLQARSVTHSRYELPWDGVLGARIAEVMEQFGVQPKKLILLPNMTTNAFALPDGSVLVTSALRTLVTDEEVAAVIAHELSHVRDGEGKKLQRFRLFCFLPVGAVAGGIGGLSFGTPLEPLMPCIIGFTVQLSGFFHCF